MNIDRSDWNQYFKEIVRLTSTRSPCKHLKVGCLLVNNNRIVSQGYNGFLPGCTRQSIMWNKMLYATVLKEEFLVMIV